MRSMVPGRSPASCRIWKPLQMPSTGPPLGRERLDRAHHRAEAGDGAGAQVVAVGEAAGQDHRVDVAEGLLPCARRSARRRRSAAPARCTRRGRSSSRGRRRLRPAGSPADLHLESSRSRGSRARGARSPRASPVPAPRPRLRGSPRRTCPGARRRRLRSRATQRVVDGLALGIEHRLLERDVDTRLHATGLRRVRHAGRDHDARRDENGDRPVRELAPAPAPARRSRRPRNEQPQKTPKSPNWRMTATGALAVSTCGAASAACTITLRARARSVP